MAHTNRVIRKCLIKKLFTKMQAGLRITKEGFLSMSGSYSGKPQHLKERGKEENQN